MYKKNYKIVIEGEFDIVPLRKKSVERYMILFLEFGILILFLYNFVGSITEANPVKNHYKIYNQNWILQFKNSNDVIDLPYTANIPKGESYLIEKTLEDPEGKADAIIFRSQQQKVRVWVGDELIYRYPEKRNKLEIVPGNWNLVKIPDDGKEKKIRIEFSSKYTAFSGRINEIYYGNYSEIVSDTRHKYLIPFMISAAIGIFGVAVMGTAFLNHRMKKRYTGKHNRTVYLGTVSEEILGMLLIIVSIWACGESKVPFSNISEITRYFITFSALMLIPIFFMAYMYIRIGENSPRIIVNLLKADILLFVFSMLMQVMGIYDFPQMLPIFHVTLGINFLTGIWCMRSQIRRGTGAFSRLEYAFVIIILLSIMMEITAFYCKRYQLIGIYIRVALLAYTLCMFLESVRRIYRTIRDNQTLTEQLNESRAELMLSQIQPHFIYNTLSSIRTLIKISPPQAYEMVYDFSNYLRANIESIRNKKIIPFSEELKHIQAYLNIEKVRFGDRVDVKYDIQTDDFYVPPLSVQPLVENAVKHGICKKPQGGTVAICTYETEEMYYVEIEDNGIGFQREKDQVKNGKGSGCSAGIDNIRFRVSVLSNAKLEIRSEVGKGTKAELMFPKADNRILLEEKETILFRKREKEGKV